MKIKKTNNFSITREAIGYAQIRTKKDCAKPEFVIHNIHRIAMVSKKYHPDALAGHSLQGICMGCGKTFSYKFFIPEENYNRRIEESHRDYDSLEAEEIELETL